MPIFLGGTGGGRGAEGVASYLPEESTGKGQEGGEREEGRGRGERRAGEVG